MRIKAKTSENLHFFDSNLMANENLFCLYVIHVTVNLDYQCCPLVVTTGPNHNNKYLTLTRLEWFSSESPL